MIAIIAMIAVPAVAMFTTLICNGDYGQHCDYRFAVIRLPQYGKPTEFLVSAQAETISNRNPTRKWL